MQTSNADLALVLLSTEQEAVLAEVGGKAASLIRLRQAGFDVPPGLVLTARFFEPWLDRLRETDEWLQVVETLQGSAAIHRDRQWRAQLVLACERVKSVAATLPFAADQSAQIDAIGIELGAGPFAVRSSSPEEDLAGASFAGLYESVLRVEPIGLPDAIRDCFCSCLDARVLLYKVEKKFDPNKPKIAVIVQRLIDSDVAGVGFSLNPLSNDFDEILINASWGLGDALVTGEITPDSVLIDKSSGEIITHHAGDKGGDRGSETCLTDGQIAELTDTVRGIETLFNEPVDVEWAISEGRLHVLQARAITAYVPLHKSLLTDPGAPRHLYMDGYLTDGITMSGATTPMSDHVFEMMMRLFYQWILGVPAIEQDLAFVGIHHGTSRMYLDLSMYMHLFGKGEALAKRTERMNPMMAAILTSPEIERYRLAKVPSHARILRILRFLPGALWRTRRALTVLPGPVFKRDQFDARYGQVIDAFEGWITRPLDEAQSVAECLTESITRAGNTILTSSYPAFLYFYLLTPLIKRLADSKSDQQRAWVDAICSGYEDDMIVHMGLMLYDLSSLLPASEFADINALQDKLKQRSLPEAFLTHWDKFVQRYGCRGPLEMELANPKYGEAPRLALQQMAGMVAAASTHNPYDMQRKQIARREQAYAGLLETLPPRKAKRLKKYYAASMRYAAAREMFKHHIMQVYGRVRSLLLIRADEFVRAGRLDEREQIFQLTVDDVDHASRDLHFDVRACAAARGAFSRKLATHVRHFPMAIDSRGRILRAPVKYADGALVGAAVSPGVARGPIKVLNDPFEKEVQAGDVLVAVTTDPGWTPLFIGAAAVILEIGGELQHGALVAREYGKPCVSGIQDVTNQFEDGQMVEVDGDHGVVRVLDTNGRP